jgi:hypothetical protein
MSGRVVAALVGVLVLAAPHPDLAAQTAVPPSSQTVRLWTQIHGRVESIRGSQVMLKTDTGQLLRVDISPMSHDERQGLVPGMRTSLTGYFGTRSNEFSAWFLPMPPAPAAPEAPAPPPTAPVLTPPAPAPPATR